VAPLPPPVPPVPPVPVVPAEPPPPPPPFPVVPPPSAACPPAPTVVPSAPSPPAARTRTVSPSANTDGEPAVPAPPPGPTVTAYTLQGTTLKVTAGAAHTIASPSAAPRMRNGEPAKDLTPPRPHVTWCPGRERPPLGRTGSLRVPSSAVMRMPQRGCPDAERKLSKTWRYHTGPREPPRLAAGIARNQRPSLSTGIIDAQRGQLKPRRPGPRPGPHRRPHRDRLRPARRPAPAPRSRPARGAVPGSGAPGR
jgi:hypothetical protein